MLLLLSLFYALFTVINVCGFWFGYRISHQTAKLERLQPLFRMYRQRIYPIHLVCCFIVLAAFVIMNYFFINPPEGRSASLFGWIVIAVLFNILFSKLTLRSVGVVYIFRWHLLPKWQHWLITWDNQWAYDFFVPRNSLE